MKILKARLLFDGGYYQRAKNTLTTKDAHSRYTLEYYYRLSRIYQAKEEYDEAQKYFTLVIAAGKKSKAYYVCSSALQLGLINEALEDYSEAILYFETCLDMDPDNYKRSLHQKAKSGLQRLKKK